MAYTRGLYHIVIRTKDSVPAIAETHERDLYHYIYAFCNNRKCWVYRIGGMPDHFHLLMDIHPTLSISDFIRELKVSTHHFMKEHKDMFPYYRSWNSGYCALSYSDSDIETVKEYIKNQKVHHKGLSVTDELRKMLTERGIVINEEYFLKNV